MYLKCCHHILNLIVNEGLKDMHNSIAFTSKVVTYVRSFPFKLQNFKSYAEQEKIE